MPNSAAYQITHRTHYRYSAAVAICQNQLRMSPRPLETRTVSLDCHSVKIQIMPEPTVMQEHTDYFGNLVLSFSIESLHHELSVGVTSEVTVHQKQRLSEIEAEPWERISQKISSGSDKRWLEIQEYLIDSPRVRRRMPFARYAMQSFTPNRPVLEATLELTERIHEDFRYDVTVTDVNTTTEEAFDLRAGVCQDFAHVQIACLRSIGIPARYVSGYLRTIPKIGQTKMIGSDESHAWISVYAGERAGWIDFDPTNACATDTNHIPICIGRDYSEVSPMRGVVLGGGSTQLSVSVDVDPLP